MSQHSGEIAELCRQAPEVGTNVDAALAANLVGYLDILYRWNDTVRLTAVPRPDALRIHLLDCLAVLPLLPASGTLVDLGSGPGFPGVVAAMARPALDVHLVESRRKRCSFLGEVLREMAVRNATVLNCRAEALEPAQRRFDCVVSRAFLAPVDFASLASRLIDSPAGRIVIMSGDSPDVGVEVCAALPELEVVETRAFVLPGGSEARSVWSFRSLGFT